MGFSTSEELLFYLYMLMKKLISTVKCRILNTFVYGVWENHHFSPNAKPSAGLRGATHSQANTMIS